MRKLEITKTITLKELDPIAFLNLKSNGTCKFELTEALFNYDFPGHYARQLKHITLVLKPGDEINSGAVLAQLHSKIFTEPDIKAVEYLTNPGSTQPPTIQNNPQTIGSPALTGMSPGVDTSSKQSLELTMDDEPYLSSEGTGLVSSWSLTLDENLGTDKIRNLTDVQLEISYTAMNGGSAFADSVRASLKPYESTVYIDLATMFPEDFHSFVQGKSEQLILSISRDMFPNISGSKISGIYSFIELDDHAKISLILHAKEPLILQSNQILISESLSVGENGEQWSLTAIGDKQGIKNIGLVFQYMAKVP